MTLGYFVGLVETGPSQELNAAIVDARRHPKAVQFYFMQLLMFRHNGRLETREGEVEQEAEIGVMPRCVRLARVTAR